MARDVFVSHSAADKVAAEAIRAACEAAGLTCWIAPRDIAAGTAWADAIVGGIAECAAVMLVHSRAASGSPMVRREIDAAAAARKPILPVRIDDAVPEQGMQFYLSSTHWFDAPPPLEAHLAQLVAAATRLVRPAAAVRTGATPPAFPEFGNQSAIAVLPFHGATPDDDPFVDGLTDELINALSRWRSFPVIARNSAFAYRGIDRDVRLIGRELGARYIVSGSARRSDTRVRVMVGLADVQTGENLMSERQDYAAGDTLAAQDEIVRALAGVLAPELLKLKREHAVRRTPAEASAYDLYELGMWHRYRNTREDLERAQGLFRAALDIDPGYARATAALSLCHNFAAISRWVDDVPGAFAESLTLARRAVADDPRDPHAHFALGVACMNVRRLPEAIGEFEHALRLNPSHSFAHANLGQAYNMLDRPDDGLAEVELALRLNPHDPRRFMWLPYVAASHYLRGRYKASLEASEQALAANPGYPLAIRYMVAALGQLGRVAEAQALLPMLRRIDRDFAGTEAMWRRLFVPGAAERLLDGVRKAGFAETRA